MRQRSRLYPIALARILPTAYARTANHKDTPSRLRAHIHARTQARTPRSAAGLGGLNCRRRCDALRARLLRVTLQHATDGMQQTACKTGQATDKRQEATKSVRHATCNVTRCDAGQATDSAHHATLGHWGGQQKTGNGERATCNKERARRHDPTVSVPLTTTGKRATDNMQHATCIGENVTDDMQHATWKLQLTTRSVHHTTSGQHAPCSGRHAANKKRRATQHAACSMLQATWN